MGITTSNFKLSGKNPLSVAISNGTRGYNHVRKYKALAPPWSLVKCFDPVEFNLEYMKQLRQLDPRKVVEEILAGHEDAIMLCWEAPGEFCHRRVVAGWLENELGILVPELDVNRAAAAIAAKDGFKQETLF